MVYDIWFQAHLNIMSVIIGRHAIQQIIIRQDIHPLLWFFLGFFRKYEKYVWIFHYFLNTTKLRYFVTFLVDGNNPYPA